MHTHNHEICKKVEKFGSYHCTNEETAHYNWWHYAPKSRYLSVNGEWDFYFDLNEKNWIEIDGAQYAKMTCSNGFPYVFNWDNVLLFQDGDRKFFYHAWDHQWYISVEKEPNETKRVETKV